MSNTLSVVAGMTKKTLIAVGFAAALGTVGSAVASADPSSGAQCEHWGIQIPCPVGAVSDTDGTQGDFRSATQGTTDSDGTQGEIRTGSQGTQDDDGFQGAYAYGSAAAFPQYR